MQALDADGDGEISAKEIENAPAALKALDRDNDGKLTRDELRPAPGGRGPGQGPVSAAAQQMVAQLMTLDKDGDGKLGKNELPEGIRVLLEGADTNKDGFLDRAELTAFAEQAARRNQGGGGRTPPQSPRTNTT
jgi:Ca2+-binding EF-hand superfamily protein